MSVRLVCQAAVAAALAAAAALVPAGCVRDDGSALHGQVKLSEAAVAAARDLGGRRCRGERLFLLVGAFADTEQEAKEILDSAVRYYDVQTYFVIQRTAAFDGLEGGPYVVFEAHSSRASAEDDLELARVGFDSPTVAEVTVLTDDPIPVYDELMRR